MPKAHYLEIFDRTYEEAWKLQTEYHERLKTLKKEAREDYLPLHELIFCEHNHVYTLGKSGKVDHLLLDEEMLERENIEFFKINRGGDITYHGPGQITGYPIFDMDDIYTDVRRYVRDLEEIMIELLKEYGLKGERIDGYTGVWIKDMKPYRKICAIGVHMSRWVTLHGFAFNVNTDLNYFKNIIPCGINDGDKDVTSLAYELGHPVAMDEVRRKLKHLFAQKFNLEYIHD